jgi:hypothetical protein
MALDSNAPDLGISRLGEQIQSAGQAFGNLYLNMQRQAQGASTDLYNAEVERQYMLGLGQMKGDLDTFWAGLENDPNWNQVDDQGVAGYQKYPDQAQEAWKVIKENASKYTTLPEAKAKLEAQFLAAEPNTMRSVFEFAQSKKVAGTLDLWTAHLQKAIDDGDQAGVAQLIQIGSDGKFLPAETLATKQTAALDQAHFNYVKKRLDSRGNPGGVLTDLMGNDADVMAYLDVTSNQLKELRAYYTDVVDKRTKATEAQIKENDNKVYANIMAMYAKDTLSLSDLQDASVITTGEVQTKIVGMMDRYKAAQGTGFEGTIKRKQNVTEISLLAQMSTYALNTDPKAEAPWIPDTLTPLVDANTIRGDQTGALLSGYNQATKDRENMANPQVRREAELRNTMYKAMDSGHNPGLPLRPGETGFGGLDFVTIENDWNKEAISDKGHDAIIAERARLMAQHETDSNNTSVDASLFLSNLVIDPTKEYQTKFNEMRDYFATKGHVSGKDQLYYIEQLDPWSKNEDWKAVGTGLSNYYDSALAAVATTSGKDSNEYKTLAMEKYFAINSMQKFMVAHSKDANPGRVYQDELQRYLADDASKKLLSLPGPMETFKTETLLTAQSIGKTREFARRYQQGLLEGSFVTEYEMRRPILLQMQQSALNKAKVWGDTGMSRTVNVFGEDEYTAANGQKYVVVEAPDKGGTVTEIVKKITYVAPTKDHPNGSVTYATVWGY